ncbi:unnamed protein product [Sphenostylis stenocarpa]|uniref:Uncharacterized protein n=1 Tax=Sphenostylis stenocarpa TaxID=92480 RepID=A0AA86VG89_9FABA|nr:unnamed protein product [Sphenostylis stenocarpa]
MITHPLRGCRLTIPVRRQIPIVQTSFQETNGFKFVKGRKQYKIASCERQVGDTSSSLQETLETNSLLNIKLEETKKKIRAELEQKLIEVIPAKEVESRLKEKGAIIHIDDLPEDKDPERLKTPLDDHK